MTSPLRECPHEITHPVMTQRWADVSFAHWRVDPERVAAILPPGLEPDLFEDSAWVSLVGFEMRDLKLRGLPRIPTTERFLEFNVRTYVTGPNGPGVWFASLDVEAFLPTATARVGFSLPYCLAWITHRRQGSQVSWSVKRRWPGSGRARLEFDIGDELAGDELDHWLTGRWALYAETRSGRLVWAPVSHEPWPLRQASCSTLSTGLSDIAGLPVAGEPERVHHADAVTVRVGRPRVLPPVEGPPLSVFFDGDCGFCQACVTWLEPKTKSRARFAPSSVLPGDSPLRQWTADALVADDGRRIHVGVGAVAAVMARTSRPWRWTAEVLQAPVVHQVADVAYRVVAKNRRWISTRLGMTACRLN